MKKQTESHPLLTTAQPDFSFDDTDHETESFLSRHRMLARLAPLPTAVIFHLGIQFLNYLGFVSKASQGFSAEADELGQLRGLNISILAGNASIPFGNSSIPASNSSIVVNAGNLFCAGNTGNYLSPFTLSQELLQRTSTKDFADLFDAHNYYAVFLTLTGAALMFAMIAYVLMSWKRQKVVGRLNQLNVWDVASRNIGKFPKTALAVTVTPIFIYALIDFWLAKWIGIAAAAQQFCSGVDLLNPYGHGNGVTGVEDEYNDVVATAMFFGKAILQVLTLSVVGYLITHRLKALPKTSTLGDRVGEEEKSGCCDNASKACSFFFSSSSKITNPLLDVNATDSDDETTTFSRLPKPTLGGES